MGLVDFVTDPLRKVVMAFRQHEAADDDFDKACAAVKMARDDLETTITELTRVPIPDETSDNRTDQG